MANGTGNGALAESNFGLEVFNAIAGSSAHAHENVVISPLLHEAALALLYLGSDGATAAELKSALQLKRFGDNVKMANFYAAALDTATRETDTKLQLSSNIIVDETLHIADEFQKIALKYFHTSAEKLELTNKAQLSSFIQETFAKIGDLNNGAVNGNQTQATDACSDLIATTSGAILLTAVNFKSKWFLPFSAYRSGTYEFLLEGSIPKTVPMLFDDDMFVKFGEFRELDCRAIELPYEHEDELAMLIFLPNKRDGLAALIQQMPAVNLSALTERMQMESVQVLLPKFRIDFVCSLRESLEKLGISSIFSKEANFKNLLQQNSSEHLKISNLLFRVHIDVNESGSEPSSVVASKPIVISNSIDSRKKFFRADHPFYFAIRSHDVTYFIGRVATF